MKIGDKVRHISLNWTGVVASPPGKYGAVCINLSDEGGVLFRRVHISNLEVVDETR